VKPDTGAGSRGAEVEADAFKRALAQLAGGIVVVTSADAKGRPAGVTATAVCSVSLDPPLVLVCLGAGSRTREVIVSSGRYAINVLGSGHRSHSERFAGTGDGKFEGVNWEPGRFGSPVFPGSIAVCECEIEQSIEAGDHTILVGRVVEATAANGPHDLPLLWYRGSYGRLSEEDGA
jgi:flavin reductase (DIM6/NTAB) family NADH-FMN oxidoreductase RutF